MNRPVAEPPAVDTDAAEVAGKRYRRRARFELIFASIWLAVGQFVLPAAIFTVGGALLGPYDEDGGLGRFYGDFLGDLVEPSIRAWALALGPLVLISGLRLIFAGAGRGPEPSQPAPDQPAAARRGHEEPRRVEPRVSTE
jgi:hypothetical protein